jgi:hypothetical protein
MHSLASIFSDNLTCTECEPYLGATVLLHDDSSVDAHCVMEATEYPALGLGELIRGLPMFLMLRSRAEDGHSRHQFRCLTRSGVVESAHAMLSSDASHTRATVRAWLHSQPARQQRPSRFILSDGNSIESVQPSSHGIAQADPSRMCTSRTGAV